MTDETPWLDAGAVLRNHDRASATYDASAILQAQLRQQMIERLDWIAFEPETILDLGCGTGHGAIALAARWPRARVIALDAAPGMLRELARHDATGRCERILGDALAVPLPDASVDLIFSSLLMHWCEDIDALFVEVARLLRPRGLYTFSTFGPDTLIELHSAWRAADRNPHVHLFADMHDIGDGLVRAGFAEPVLDVTRYTLTYPDVRALMRDLKAIGSQNAATARLRGLTGRGRLRAVEEAYESRRRDGALPASYEVVFGQAWGALERGERDGEVAVPVSGIGRRGAGTA